MVDYNSLSDLIRRRRSIRVYDPDKPVAWEDLKKILQAGLWAPTGSNQQELRYMIITDRDAIRRMLTIKPVKNATAMIVVFFDTSIEYYREYKRCKTKQPLPYLDAGACAMNMLLAAESLGINACWLNVLPWIKRPRDRRPDNIIGRGFYRILEILNHFFNLGYLNYNDLIHREWNVPRRYRLLTAIALGYGKYIPDIQKARHGGNPLMRKPVDEHIIEVMGELDKET